MSELQINPKFEQYLPELSKEEFEVLRQSCLSEGIRDSIKVWQNQIIDGHNRYKIAEMHELPYAITDLHFSSEEAAIEWMLINQLGRRNLEPNLRTLYLGQLYESEKKKVGNPQFSSPEAPENGELFGDDDSVGGSTAERIAAEHGVSPKTVKNAGKVAKAFDQADEETKKDFKQGKVTQKRLLEKTAKTEIAEETELPNPHLNNIRYHAKRIREAVKNMAAMIEDYDRYLHSAKLPLQKFAPVLHKPETLELLRQITAYAAGLKEIEPCPLCEAKGCERCNDTGFLSKEDFESVKRDMGKGEKKK